MRENVNLCPRTGTKTLLASSPVVNVNISTKARAFRTEKNQGNIISNFFTYNVFRTVYIKQGTKLQTLLTFTGQDLIQI